MKNIHYLNLSLKDYVDEVATKAMPGGGSVAALAGALGIAILIKALLLNHKEMIEELTYLKNRFLSLVDEDIKNFKIGLKEATCTLVEICKSSGKALAISGPILKKSKPILKGDIGAAIGLLVLSFHSAELNIDVNLKGIKDKKFTIRTIKTIKPLSAKITKWQRSS